MSTILYTLGVSAIYAGLLWLVWRDVQRLRTAAGAGEALARALDRERPTWRYAAVTRRGTVLSYDREPGDDPAVVEALIANHDALEAVAEARRIVNTPR